MASFADLARDQAGLAADDVDHLQRLLRTWALLADLSIADVQLFLADTEAGEGGFVVAAHVRPTTGQTIYRHDPVGDRWSAADRPRIADAFASGRIVEGDLHHPSIGEPVTVTAIPVRRDGTTIAVISREARVTIGRSQGELEQAYRGVFEQLIAMICAGTYPYPDDPRIQYRTPRIGDGVIVLDADARVVYNSPNAVSALHRLGVGRNAEGLRLGEVGLDETVIDRAFRGPRPTMAEVERGRDVTVVVHCIPLLDGATVTGAVVLVRDVSDLRRRDRMLLSKDATIREIHHRVKNNLQTIASLLRLQARRLQSPEGVAALQESVRRIASIALVHETLAQDTGESEDEVAFVDVVRPLVRMVEEGLVSPDRPARFSVQGDAGRLPAQLAMPLAVVITELLQNAVDHAFPHGGGTVTVTLAQGDGTVLVTVADDGIGVPAGFDAGADDGLGMTIVRTFICSDLGGTIRSARGSGPGDRPGTTVRLEVPIGRDDDDLAG